MRRRSLASAPQRARGVAAVEFALLMPLLVAMVFGTTELGRAVYTYNTLAKTVRDAARHLSQHGPGDPAVAAEAQCLAVYGSITCGGTPVAPGLSTSAIVVCDATTCAASHASQPIDPTGAVGGVMNLVSVTVQGYAYSSFVNFVVPSMSFNDITATMRGQL